MIQTSSCHLPTAVMPGDFKGLSWSLVGDMDEETVNTEASISSYLDMPKCPTTDEDKLGSTNQSQVWGTVIL